jgi:glycerate 2-kinase
VVDLELIYRKTLAACAPEVIVRAAVDASMPRNVVAIGKCAGRMVSGVDFDRGFCVVPRGYPRPDPSPSSGLRMTFGGHPDIDDDSFAAGDALVDFVDQCDDVLFLISGGGSACVEVPLPPFTRDEVATTSARLVASSLSIGEINTVRKHLSAIKGGRLGTRVHGRSVTLVYSDVSTGAIGDVASAPTVADRTTNADAARILERLGGCEPVVAKLRVPSTPETVRRIHNAIARVIADNATLTSAAARFVEDAGLIAVMWPQQIESSVEDAARELADRAATLNDNEVLIAGGEPVVARHGTGKGGRCCELAVRFAMRSDRVALFGTSDGVDGSSGIAGISVEAHFSAPSGQDRGLKPSATQKQIQKLLDNSDSLAAALLIGRAVIMPPTGNNLRDLFLVAGVNRRMAHH